MKQFGIISVAVIALFIQGCKKKDSSEPATTNPPAQTNSQMKEGYLKFVTSIEYANLSSSAVTNYDALSMFWDNNNGNKTYIDPDSVSINGDWLNNVSGSTVFEKRKGWMSPSAPLFVPYNPISWYVTGSTSVPVIVQNVPGVPYIDKTYFPADADLADSQISLSKSGGFTFTHASLSGSRIRYFITSTSGSSTKSAEKIVNNSSSGITFSATDLSVFPSGYINFSLYIEVYQEVIVSPLTSSSFTLSNINSMKTLGKFIN